VTLLEDDELLNGQTSRLSDRETHWVPRRDFMAEIDGLFPCFSQQTSYEDVTPGLSVYESDNDVKPDLTLASTVSVDEREVLGHRGSSTHGFLPLKVKKRKAEEFLADFQVTDHQDAPQLDNLTHVDGSWSLPQTPSWRKGLRLLGDIFAFVR
jgi:hypothetical protein